MKLHHITLTSLAVSAAVSFYIFFGLCNAKGVDAITAAFSVIWLLLSVAGLFAEVTRKNDNPAA